MPNYRNSIIGRKEREGKREPCGYARLMWVELILLVTGVLLIGVYGAARIESYIASRAAVRRFSAAARAPTMNVSIASNFICLVFR
jgi:hypothetical protein